MNTVKVNKNEPMKNHTTWRIGGPAKVLIKPETIEELQSVLQDLQEKGESFVVIGGGSNLLVSDEGINRTVIQLGSSLRDFSIDGEWITAQAGVPLPFIARKAAEQELSGLEFAAGIPGTIGGAVVMNAGAYKSQFSNIVQEVVCCDKTGKLLTLDSTECNFSYRNSRFKRNDELIVLSVKMRLTPGKKEEILEQMNRNTSLRKEKQPVEYPSAGSIFKNPEGDSAGRLIESVGAKGWKQGGAMVSEKHSNFIVNTGSATCKDVLELVSRVKKEVQDKTGVQLEEEILFLD